MLLSVTPLAVIATAIWLAPGLIWAWLAYPAPDRLPRLAIGAALGLALQIDLAAPLANTVGITLTSVAISTEAALALAIALGLLMRVRTARLPSNAAARRSETRWFLLLALASVVVCAIPLAFQTVPDGWDPSFHSLLANVILATGKLPSWRPYEQIASNYPYGAHVALAEISLLTGLHPDQVFGVLLNVVVPALAALQIYALARRMWRTGPAALGAVAAYGLLGYYNSVDYGAWGGLPNALGMILVLASLEALFAPGFTWRRIGVAGVLLSAMPLTHHHVAISAGLIFGVYIVALLIIMVARRPAALRAPLSARRSARNSLLRLGAIIAVAALLAGYAFIPYVQRGLHTLGDTSIFADLHEYSGLPFDKNGNALWLMAALGAALALWYLWRATAQGQERKERLLAMVERLYPRRGSGQLLLFSALALVALFAAFIVGQFIFHAVVLALRHKDETALTPTRFLSNMTYFLALFAGPGLAWLWMLRPHALPKRVRGYVGSWARPLVRVALVVMTIGASAASLVASQQVGAGKGQLLPGDLDAFEWVRAHTPTNTLVVAPNADMIWAPYFTQREADYTPLPTSEDVAGYPAQKQLLVGWALQAMNAQPNQRVLAVANAGPASAVLASRPLAFITRTPSSDFGTLAYTSGAAHVYLAGSLLSLARAEQAPKVTLWWRSAAAGAPTSDWMSPAFTPSIAAGWTSSAQVSSGPSDASWLRMTLSGPIPVGSGILCQAEDGAAVAIDGTTTPGGCQGRLIPLSQLSDGSGSHTLAFEVGHLKHADPWLSVMVVGPDATP